MGVCLLTETVHTKPPTALHSSPTGFPLSRWASETIRQDLPTEQGHSVYFDFTFHFFFFFVHDFSPLLFLKQVFDFDQ